MAADSSKIGGAMASEPNGSYDEVWKKGARACMGALSPLPFQGKPALKTLDAEVQRQLAHVYKQVQQDLDLLHEQVHAEVHAAITKELQGVARRMAEVSQGADSCRREVEPMRGTMQQLVQEAQWTRQRLEADMKEAREAASNEARQASAATSEELSAALQREASTLRGELAVLREQLAQELVSRLQEVQAAHSEAQGKHRRELEEATAGQTRWLEELTQEAARVKGEVDEERGARERLAGRLECLGERLDEGLAEGLRVASEGGRAEDARAEASLAELGEALRGEAAVGEARFQELQAAIAGLEERAAASLREALDAAAARAEGAQHRLADSLSEDLQERLRSATGDVKDRLVALDARVERIDAECTAGLGLASSGWARTLEWQAGVDVAQLEGAGRLDVESPPFAAAGLRDLRLHLRLHGLGGGRGEDAKQQRWACGAFLRAREGQASFRMHINGRSQTFAGDFAEASEWGSQRIAVLERPEAAVLVRLEILDVTAPIRPSVALPPELSATLQIADAAQTAAREVAALRASMVRKVEWRVARVSERLAAARAAAGSLDEEAAVEPICSPPFAAAGVEGLQLQLYPLGYRSRGDEMCGFFLVCPRGAHVKCRAFVGDASRTFDHYFEAREPYGRGSFCRLADKVGEDDTVTCGVEFLEVWQEQTLQVRGGPFGTVADQLKVVAGASGGGMEQVRELREAPVGGGREAAPPVRPKGARLRPCAAAMGTERFAPAAAPRPSAAQLAVSKSLPVLLPAVGGGQGPGVATYTAGTPTRRQADLTVMH